ncbi:MAG: putative Zn-dependent protease [Paracoccaceae bacterium]|jgi:predicted Zn-dependent protease
MNLIPSITAAVVVVALLSGCAKNPATGGTAFTGGLSQSQEIQMGRENHPKIIKEFGGEYGTPALKRYVDGIGQLLAKTSERPDLKFTFTVLNSDIINAFATPGGYVYITRGLMALADNEAQLAGVLAHEIGHITALHHARRHGQSLLANIGLAAVGILGGREVAQVGQLGAVSLLQSFSRGNEYEADELGVRYLSRVGFDPTAMAGFLSKLRADTRLSALRRGESPDKVDQFNYLATHPAPAARVKRAAALAREKNVKNPMTARDIYLSKLDGLLYGSDPDEGFIRGQDFLHPKLRFAFAVPAGFNLMNSNRAVYALGPNKSRIIFDRAGKPVAGSMENYVGRVWGSKMRLRDLETIRANGLEAATATTQVRTKDGTFDARLTAYRVDAKTIYRMIFLTAGAETNRLATGLRRTTYSFRRLSTTEASRLRPLVLRIVTVQRGDTVESLASRLPYSDYKLERFEVLNGISRNDRLRRGQKLKMVTTN